MLSVTSNVQEQKRCQERMALPRVTKGLMTIAFSYSIASHAPIAFKNRSVHEPGITQVSGSTDSE